jgi:carbonic anhydrase/acetyltransferase-like protein (isoleucine patch superfamily)
MNLPPDPFPTGLPGVAARLEHGPQIHPSVFVAANATIVGDVTLMEESSVWFGALLRGDINRIVVGTRSNLQDGVIVHLSDDFPAIVGSRVTIGHGAIVHACTIEDEVLVGMGAIILDGAEIGARSIVGANALVTTGAKIPPGSLVYGAPARVISSLGLHEQQSIAQWADKYAENARHFRAAPGRPSNVRSQPIH